MLKISKSTQNPTEKLNWGCPECMFPYIVSKALPIFRDIDTPSLSLLSFHTALVIMIWDLWHGDLLKATLLALWFCDCWYSLEKISSFSVYHPSKPTEWSPSIPRQINSGQCSLLGTRTVCFRSRGIFSFMIFVCVYITYTNVQLCVITKALVRWNTGIFALRV